MAKTVEIRGNGLTLPVVDLPDYPPETIPGFPPDLNYTINTSGRWIDFSFEGEFSVRLLPPTKSHAPAEGEHIVGWFRKKGNSAPWTFRETSSFFEDQTFHRSFLKFTADYYKRNPESWMYMMLGYPPKDLPERPWLYNRAGQSQEPLHFHITSYSTQGVKQVVVPDNLIDQLPHILNISGETAVEELSRKKGTNDRLPLIERGELIRYRQPVNLQLSRFSTYPGRKGILNKQGLLRTFLGFTDLAEFFKAYRDTVAMIEKNGDMGLAWYEDFAEGVIKELEKHPMRIGPNKINHLLPRVFGGEVVFVSPEIRTRLDIPDRINLLFRLCATDTPQSLILPQGPIIQRRFSA